MDLDALPGETGRAAEIGQVDDESSTNHVGTELAQQFDRGFGRAAGGDQVVDEEHRLARLQSILMDFDDVDAVFELVFLTDGLGRQLALLADRYEAAAQTVSDRAAEDEAARFNARHRLDSLIGKRRDQPLDAGAQAVGMAEQRGDVAKHDARLRIVRYRAHEVLEIDVCGQAHARASCWASRSGTGFCAYSATKRG